MAYYHNVPDLPDPPSTRLGQCKTCGFWDRTGDGRGWCLVDDAGQITYPDDGCAEWRGRDRL